MLGLRFCARAFSSCGKRGPLFIAVRGPLTIAAPLVAEHRLQTHRLSSCGSRAQLLRGMWDLPRPGLEPVFPALAGRCSTTAPPGKPSGLILSDWESVRKFEAWRHFCALMEDLLSVIEEKQQLIWSPPVSQASASLLCGEMQRVECTSLVPAAPAPPWSTHPWVLSLNDDTKEQLVGDLIVFPETGHNRLWEQYNKTHWML